MPSQHRHPSHGFRPDPAEYAAAREILSARGETTGTFLRACVRWLVADPDAALAALGDSWSGARALGRPRGDSREAPDTATRS